MNDGIYEGLSFADYKAIKAINKSGLDKIHLSPAHYFAEYLGTQGVEESTAAMRLGSAIHTRVLEPEEFEKRYMQTPVDPPRRPDSRQRNAKKPSEETILAIKWWDEFEATANGREILSDSDWHMCHRIAENLNKKATGRELFDSGMSEVTIVWTDPLTNAKCKARIDRVAPGALIDLKSTICAAPESWWREVKKYNLHCQAAWYSDGWKVLTGEDVLFVFAAFEKEEPFEGGFYVAKERVVELGRSINRRALKKYVQCEKTANWTGYKDELVEFDFPEYLFKDEETQPIEEY